MSFKDEEIAENAPQLAVYRKQPVGKFALHLRVGVQPLRSGPSIDRPIRLTKPRKPIPRKRKGPARRGRKLDPDYLAFIGTLPCCVCFAACYRSGEVWMLIDVGWEPAIMRGDSPAVQESRTEAAHVGPHGSSDQKADDRETAPLCHDEHHQNGPESHHKLRTKFWEHHGIDWPKLRAALQARYDAQR